MVALACNPSFLEGRSRYISEFEASLVYRMNSRTSRATHRNPVSKKIIIMPRNLIGNHI